MEARTFSSMTKMERVELSARDGGFQELLKLAQNETPRCEGRNCEKPGEFLLHLVNDPSVYCNTCALRSDAYWRGLGFPAPEYIRLSDSRIMRTEPDPTEATGA